MNRKVVSLLLLSVFILVIVSGCLPPPKPTTPDFTPPKLVALLLLDNQSNDLQIAELVRKLFYKRLVSRGFNLIPLAVVDTMLLELGITDGGQLSIFSPWELGDSLGVDWLVYGTVIEADYITTGIYLKKSVKVHFNIVSTLTDTTIWEGEGEDTKSELCLSLKEAGKALVDQLTERTLSGIFDHPLREEAKCAVNKASVNLPLPSGYYTRQGSSCILGRRKSHD